MSVSIRKLSFKRVLLPFRSYNKLCTCSVLTLYHLYPLSMDMTEGTES